MTAWNDLDHDPTILDALDGFVARVDRQLFADRLLDRDLTSFSYSTAHVRMVGRSRTCVNGPCALRLTHADESFRLTS